MTTPPSGEVTFLFTDIEGSTGLWERHPESMQVALAEHDSRMRTAITDHDGYIFTTAGDSFAVAFASAAEAVAAALQAQLSLLAPCGEIEIRVRMALHTGTATMRGGDYFGAVVNRTARLMAAGHGGQILLSRATAHRVRETLPPGTELIDMGERRLKDLLRPEHVYQLQHPELGRQFPDMKTLDGPWSNLPIQLTSFVGREHELVDVQKLLASHRLVTLTGTGGAGKTRLALQLAAEQLENFPEGARLIELAALTDPDLVADETAEAFGAQTAPDTPVVDSIAAKIGKQRMLLVLDNCEHLINPVAELCSRLLGACPALKILATSRELLGVPGGVFYRVPSLPVPVTSDPQEAMQYGAVQLFAERAGAVKPDFVVDADNVASVVAICRRLDGIPLAIELAAARLRVLSASQIDARLDERFRLLGSTKTTRVERHQTLQAAIDWSHTLLDHDEQILFRRLSVFAGNFTLHAVEAVCAREPLDSFAILDLLSALVDKSMVIPDEGSGDEPRYRLLTSLRAYGSAKLSETREEGVISRAQGDYFAQLSERLQVMQRGGEIGSALVLLDQDEDNVRAALDHCFATGQIDISARIVGAIGYLWYVTGAHREGIDWCEQLFAPDPDLPDELLAPALHSYALLLGSWERPDVGIEILEREVELRTRMGDPARLAAALNNLGNLLTDVGDRPGAETTLQEAIAQYRIAGEPATLALASLGEVFQHAGQYERARDLYSEALDEAQSAADDYGIALATTNLGKCAAHLGRIDEARPLLEQARAAFAALGVIPGVADVDFHLALVHRADGKPAEAAACLMSSLESPDAHWYLAAKYWILQIAASLIPDRPAAARLLGVAAAYYDEASEVQPVFVRNDLDETQHLLSVELGEDVMAKALAAGHRSAYADALESARKGLDALTRAESPGTHEPGPLGSVN